MEAVALSQSHGAKLMSTSFPQLATNLHRRPNGTLEILTFNSLPSSKEIQNTKRGC
jgi:hypothetical protein